jgi:hypothetical protein
MARMDPMHIKKHLTPHVLSTIAIVISVAALAGVGFVALNIDRYVDAGVRDAVLVTKIRLAELEAAAATANAKTTFIQRKDYVAFKEAVTRVATDLSAVYSQAPEAEQQEWQSLKAQFDELIKAIESKDKEVAAKTDAIIARLRTDRDRSN